MTCQRSRRAAVAVALAGALALTAPAHAAGWDGAVFPGWFEKPLSWVARLWTRVDQPEQLAPASGKFKVGTQTDGASAPQSPPPVTNSDFGGATDPDG
jgi:hypothetical protein